MKSNSPVRKLLRVRPPAALFLILWVISSGPDVSAQTGTWKELAVARSPGAHYSLIDFADSLNGWLFSADGWFTMTSDGGATWGPASHITDSGVVVSVKYYDRNTGTALLAHSLVRVHTLILTTDRGDTWVARTIPDSGLFPGSISIVNRHLFGALSTASKLYTSTDLGATWQTHQGSRATIGFLAILKNGKAFTWSPVAGMLNDGFLYSSSDTGITWSPVGVQTNMSGSYGRAYSDDLCFFSLGYGADPPPPLYAISIFYNAQLDSIEFTGQDVWGALYDDRTSLVIPRGGRLAKVSGDPADSTYVIQSGTNGPAVVQISTVARKFSWILSDSGRVFQRIDLLTGIRSTSPQVLCFRLYQNYPNPFNPSTTIRYSLPKRSPVILSVYNTLGQVVTTLVNGIEESGIHEARYDGSALASGVYFYRLSAGEFEATKRLILLR